MKEIPAVMIPVGEKNSLKPVQAHLTSTNGRSRSRERPGSGFVGGVLAEVMTPREMEERLRALEVKPIEP